MSWKLFTDTPVADIGDADLARSNQVVRSLYAQLQLAERQVKANSNKTNEHKSYDYARFALCGGLGQGKSSAILQLCKLLKQEIKIKDLNVGNNQAWICKPFDVSKYRHLELEYSFDDFIHSFFLLRLLWRLAPLLLVCLTIAAPQLYLDIFLTQPSEDEQSVRSAWAEYLAQWPGYLLASLLLLWNSPKILGNITRIWLISARKEFFQGLANQSWHNALANHLQHLWQQILAAFKPRLIIIDNLDRASIQQQRSLLRGLYKNQQLLHFHVLLVLDENSLMLAANDPESPQELLRKVTDAQFRLPARSPETLVWQSLNLCREAANKNSEANFFQQPIFCCDLLLLLSWLPNPGPRLIKQLLNNLLTYSEGNLNTIDASALLKICAIDLLAPGLRLRPGLLLELLNSTVSTELENILDKCEQNAELKRGIDWPRLRGLLMSTMGSRPQSDGGNWKNIIANLSRAHKQEHTPRSHELFPLSETTAIENVTKKLKFTDLQLVLQLLHDIVDGKSTTDSLIKVQDSMEVGYDSETNNSLEQPMVLLLLLLNLFVSICRYLNHQQRWHFYHGYTLLVKIITYKKAQEQLMLLLYRYWCIDHTTLINFHTDADKILTGMIRHGEVGSYLAANMSSEFLSSQQQLSFIANLESSDDVVYYLRNWWHVIDKELPDSDFILNYGTDLILKNIWPADYDPSDKVKCLESLHTHIKWLQKINGSGVWPASLERLLFENGFWQELLPKEQSKLLQALAFHKRQPNLPLLTAFLEGRPTYFYKDDTNGLARLATQIQDSDSAACLLLIDCLARSKKSIRDEDKIELAQPHYSSLIMHLNNAHLLAVLINKLTVDFLWTRLDLPALRSCLVLLSQLGDGEQLKSDLMHILVRVNNENLPQLISQQNNIRLLPALSGDPEMDANLLKLLDSCSYSLRANYIFNHHQQLLNTNARNILEHHQMLALLYGLITNAPIPNCSLIEAPNKLSTNNLPADDMAALMLKRAILQARRRLLEFNQKHLVQLIKLDDSEEAQVFIKFTTIHRFNIWFDYYYPFLCLQLPDKPDDVMKELKRRLQVLLHRSLDLELNQENLLDKLFDTLSSETFKRNRIAHTGSN